MVLTENKELEEKSEMNKWKTKFFNGLKTIFKRVIRLKVE
jgi:hypothetical protein